MWYHARSWAIITLRAKSADLDDLALQAALITRDRAWYHMIEHMMVLFFLFFLSRIVAPKQFGPLSVPGSAWCNHMVEDLDIMKHTFFLWTNVATGDVWNAQQNQVERSHTHTQDHVQTYRCLPTAQGPKQKFAEFEAQRNEQNSFGRVGIFEKITLQASRCFVCTLVWELKPEVQIFVCFGGRGGGGVSSETNFVRFAGLLRTFAMAPYIGHND